MKKIIIIVTFLVTLLLVTPFVFASSGAPTMIDGASIRTSGEQGLRFYANLENEAVTSQGFYLVYGEASVVNLQTAISNAVEGNVMLNGKKVFKVEVENREPNGDFSVVLTGIPEVGYLDKITAIAYGVVDNAEVFVSAGTTRSIGEVAYKMAQAGQINETARQILDVIDNEFSALFERPWGTFEESSGIYSTDPEEIEQAFIADWNSKFGTTWTDIDATTFAANTRMGGTGSQGTSTTVATTRIYQFFNDSTMKYRWEWLLDYFMATDNITHAARQATAIKGDGTNGTYALYWADHLTYSISNFFNYEHKTGWSTAMNFTVGNGTTRHRRISEFNNRIVRQADFNMLNKVGDVVVLPNNLTKLGHTFDNSYSEGLNNYTSSYTLTGESKILTPNFTAITYDINFFDGVDELDFSVNNYDVNQNVTLPSYSKEGYVFEGWYDNAEFIGSPISNIASGNTGNKTFYAKMVASEFVQVEVTLNLEGGLLSSSDIIDYVSTAKYVVATRYSTAGDVAGADITVGTARGGLYWYVMGFKPTAISGIYQLVGKGTGYTNAEATLYISYHDSSTSPYKTLIASIYSTATVGDYVVIEWLPAQVMGTTSIDMYFVKPVQVNSDLVLQLTVHTEMITPVKPGYTFAGWYDNSDFNGTPIFTYPGFTAEDNITSITYYAKWVAN
ncbi:InlB B-repeat-containing protein [Acholeplasma laidlawii]|uniref:InlB B-repeat-containing protein n=1 Tax=Acholeplasma laidlawii TaxID=2148 RepID=UPI00253FAD03|nr:InlB B-repeat-containing protein [Acholeplasma laidlawii]